MTDFRSRLLVKPARCPAGRVSSFIGGFQSFVTEFWRFSRLTTFSFRKWIAIPEVDNDCVSGVASVVDLAVDNARLTGPSTCGWIFSTDCPIIGRRPSNRWQAMAMFANAAPVAAANILKNKTFICFIAIGTFRASVAAGPEGTEKAPR